jgi:hypothetical protein
VKQIALLLSMSIALLLSGCLVAVPGHLYPVHGPLATQTPPPIYKVSLSGILKSGTLDATMQDGEVCRGGWAAIPQDDPTASSMSTDWDSVYGQGFFTGNVLGNAVFVRANLVGPKGTTLDVQMYDPKPGNPAALIGVARDNKGNIFKLTF